MTGRNGQVLSVNILQKGESPFEPVLSHNKWDELEKLFKELTPMVTRLLRQHCDTISIPKNHVFYGAELANHEREGLCSVGSWAVQKDKKSLIIKVDLVVDENGKYPQFVVTGLARMSGQLQQTIPFDTQGSLLADTLYEFLVG